MWSRRECWLIVPPFCSSFVNYPGKFSSLFIFFSLIVFATWFCNVIVCRAGHWAVSPVLMVFPCPTADCSHPALFRAGAGGWIPRLRAGAGTSSSGSLKSSSFLILCSYSFLQEMYISSSVKMCMHDLMIQKQSKCLRFWPNPWERFDFLDFTKRTLFRKPKARFNPLERTWNWILKKEHKNPVSCILLPRLKY